MGALLAPWSPQVAVLAPWSRRWVGTTLAALLLAMTSCQSPRHEILFGAIADCQYANQPDGGQRYYRQADDKLRQAVTELNRHPLDFVVHLGDFIDQGRASFDVVDPIFASLSSPGRHVLGNHDYSVADEWKSRVPELLGLTENYYTWSLHDWRFIVLDGNDISFYAQPQGTPGYQQAEDYYQDHQLDAPRWNGAAGAEQLGWLEQQLRAAAAERAKVIVMCHFPVHPQGVHELWNAAELRRILVEHRCVKLYLNGHNHAGAYGAVEGLHFVTLKGMVDTHDNSFAIVRIHQDQILIEGFGRESDRVLAIR